MKNYDVETIGACINDLLERLDQACGQGMHLRGQTPDWYVAAAAVACDIQDGDGAVRSFYKKEQ